MKVKDIMTRGVETIDPDATLREAAEKMRDLNVGVLPVDEDGEVVGILTDRDVTVRAIAEGFDPNETEVRDVMTEDVEYIYDDEDVERAGEVMKDRQIRRLVVLDRNENVVGILSLGDLAVDREGHKIGSEVLREVSEPAKPER